MLQFLTTNERAAHAYLAHITKSIWGIGFQEYLAGDDPVPFRQLLRELCGQWQDNPKAMLGMLGFNLPKVLDMKMVTIEDINGYLRTQNYPFRVIGEQAHTSTAGAWVADAGPVGGHDEDFAGNFYIDSMLERYLRLGNGRLFLCTNGDLRALSDVERVQLRAYLLHLID